MTELAHQATSLRGILELYDRHLRIELARPGAKAEVLPHVVRVLQPAPRMNFIAFSRLEEGSMTEAIEEQIRYLQALDQPFAWDVCAHDAPPSLRSRLIALGFIDDDDPDAVMLLRLKEAQDDLLRPTTLDVRRATHADEIRDVVEILTQVYGGNFGWLETSLLAHLEIPDYLNVYVAYSAGQPVCAGWVYFYPGTPFAGLFGGATLPAFRQQGFYRAVLAARVQAAADRGFRYLTTGASPMSRPVLARSGFNLITTAYTLRWGGREQA